MISVILPTYNRANWLIESVESIMAQDYKDWELIIVDDCSTDNTGEIVKKLIGKDSRIRYIRNDSNKKLPASLNVGMRHAKGEYITWTSDDNTYKSNAFSVMLKVMEGCSAEIGLVFAEFDHIDKNGKKVGTYKIPNNLNKIYWENIVGCAFLYKRSVIDKIGWYDENKFLIEDYDYWLRIADCFEIKPIRKSIYNSRIHDNSLSTTRAKEVLQLKHKILKENLNKKINDEIRKMIYQELALISYELDDYANMYKCVEIALKKYPDIKFNKRIKRAIFLGESFTRIYKKIRAFTRMYKKI